MYKVKKPYSSRIIVVSILLFFLNACGKTASASPSSVGRLLNIAGEPVPGIAAEQMKGYVAGFEAADAPFIPGNIPEGDEQSVVQRTIRDMVQDQKFPLIAMLGGTSNSGTAHAAALVNFFNIPMLVPSADGDNLFLSNNLWAFRLSARGKDYAKKLFGEVITKQGMDASSAKADGAADAQLELNVAILYEQNTFGESAAVEVATAAMAQSTETVKTATAPARQSINIRLYTNFKDKNPDSASLKTLAEDAQKKRIQLVYLISSDPTLAKTLIQTFRAVFNEKSMPILIGQAGGFATQDFISSKEAEGVYVLRQKIYHESCPPNVKAIYDAQSYAAVSLLDDVVQQADAKLAGIIKKFSLSWQPTSAVQQRREEIRDGLKVFDGDVRCLGKVAFNNTGENTHVELELVHIINGVEVDTLAEDFMKALKKRIAPTDDNSQ